MTTTSILAVHGLSRLSQSDLRALADAAEQIGTNADNLACVISFETGGSFDPAQKNKYVEAESKRRNRPYYGAVGLIQFMPETCADLFKLDRKVRAQCEQAMALMASMTFEGQLQYVVRYFASAKGRLNTLEDVYLKVFYPIAMGQKDDYVVGNRDAPGFIGRVYEQNSGFDRNNDGRVTKGEICSTIRAVRDRALGVRIVLEGQS